MVFLEEKVKKILETFFTAQDSLVQSFLFYGETDLGKKEVALYFAQSMMCQEPVKKWGGCKECIVCQNFQKGISDDLLLIEPNENNSIKIEEVRKAIDFLSYKPQSSSYRVLIINHADKLTLDAQNSLLKTLEEPPLGALIILISSRPKMLLETVRSRLLLIRFYRSSQEEISDYLIRYYQVEPLKAKEIAELSQGKIKLAFKLLDDDYRKEIISLQNTLEKLINSTKLNRLDILNSILQNKEKREVLEIIKLWLEKLHLDFVKDPQKINNRNVILLTHNLINAFNLINQYNININLLLENIFLQI